MHLNTDKINGKIARKKTRGVYILLDWSQGINRTGSQSWPGTLEIVWDYERWPPKLTSMALEIMRLDNSISLLCMVIVNTLYKLRQCQNNCKYCPLQNHCLFCLYCWFWFNSLYWIHDQTRHCNRTSVCHRTFVLSLCYRCYYESVFM